MFYKGIVNAYDKLSGKHRVLYDDGEWEFIDLCAEPVLIEHSKEHSLDSLGPTTSSSSSTSPPNEYLSGNDPLVFCRVENSPVSDNLPKKAGRGRPPKSTSPNVIKPLLLATSHEKKDLKRKEMDDPTNGSLSSDRRISSRLTIPPKENNSIKRGGKKGGREPIETVNLSARGIKDVNSSHSKPVGRPPRTAAVTAAANIKNNSKL
mmetsp:Transcript_3685/g.3836  ORF Transcript_3685/g.3836 Transcript_3685/m.3836 type:complete len:206 (-) Transcript_3685:116-733(-)